MKLKSFFKVGIKQNWQPTIREVEYMWEDGAMHKWLEFEWYASTKAIDRGMDIVEPSAFRKTLSLFMENPQLFLQHDANKPVGSIVEASITEEGLYVKGVVKIDTDNIFQKLRTGVIKTMSFGYVVKDYTTKTVQDTDGTDMKVNVITELELFEVSLVSVPMNPTAKIKNIDEIPTDLPDEEYKELFQVDKQDEFPLAKSFESLLKKSEEVSEEAQEEMPESEAESVEAEEVIVAEADQGSPDEEATEESTEESEEEAVAEETAEEEVAESVEEATEEAQEEVEESNEEEVEESNEEVEDIDEVVEETEEDDEEEAEKANDAVETKELAMDDSIKKRLTEMVMARLAIDEDTEDEYVYVVDVFDSEFVFNHVIYTSEEYSDKYYRMWYERAEDGEMTLVGEPVEVEAESYWVDAKANFVAIDKKEMEEKSPACRQSWESRDACVSRKISELIDEWYERNQAVAIANNMCDSECKSEEKKELDTETEEIVQEMADDVEAVAEEVSEEAQEEVSEEEVVEESEEEKEESTEDKEENVEEKVSEADEESDEEEKSNEDISTKDIGWDMPAASETMEQKDYINQLETQLESKDQLLSDSKAMIDALTSKLDEKNAEIERKNALILKAKDFWVKKGKQFVYKGGQLWAAGEIYAGLKAIKDNLD